MGEILEFVGPQHRGEQVDEGDNARDRADDIVEAHQALPHAKTKSAKRPKLPTPMAR